MSVSFFLMGTSSYTCIIYIYVSCAAFAWLKCQEPMEDCEGFLRSNNIITRSGKHFGVSPQYVRISMLDRDENFYIFVERLSTIHQRQSVQVDETGE
jgi:L-tryptophan--pyruvate aminotransferase